MSLSRSTGIFGTKRDTPARGTSSDIYKREHGPYLHPSVVPTRFTHTHACTHTRTQRKTHRHTRSAFGKIPVTSHVLSLPTAREGNVFRRVSQSFCSGGRETEPPLDTPPTDTAWTENPPDRESPPTETHPLLLTSSGSQCSSRFASYWNAFLFSFLKLFGGHMSFYGTTDIPVLDF